MAKKRKGPVEIRFELLEELYYAGGAMKKTHLWRRTNMSYDDFIKHVSFLVEKGLVEVCEEGFKISEKGMEIYEKLKDYIASLF
ncbi:MAG: hypothetical protein DRJ44_07740 [Thermoprotei archaeon]|nr:MAG: hypothetical protein DRJ44_07740 [Thermoprotei archaeon]